MDEEMSFLHKYLSKSPIGAAKKQSQTNAPSQEKGHTQSDYGGSQESSSQRRRASDFDLLKAVEQFTSYISKNSTELKELVEQQRACCSLLQQVSQEIGAVNANLVTIASNMQRPESRPDSHPISAPHPTPSMAVNDAAPSLPGPREIFQLVPEDGDAIVFSGESRPAPAPAPTRPRPASRDRPTSRPAARRPPLRRQAAIDEDDFDARDARTDQMADIMLAAEHLGATTLSTPATSKRPCRGGTLCDDFSMSPQVSKRKRLGADRSAAPEMDAAPFADGSVFSDSEVSSHSGSDVF